MGLKEWCVGQITVPQNFQQILKSSSPDPNSETTGKGLEVICVGFSRTGTSSLKAALSKILPGKTFHAMDFLNSINEEASHKFWKSLEEQTATSTEIQEFFRSRNYSAVCDTPCITFWREILRAHPHAKIILTVRNPRDWFTSINKALVPLSTQILRWSWMLKIICYIFYRHAFQVELLRILFQPFQSKELLTESTACEFYEGWNKDILASVPSSNLLVFDVKQGWTPLCQFLGCKQPEEPFPRLNDASALINHQRYITFLVSLAFLSLLVVFLLIGWVLFSSA